MYVLGFEGFQRVGVLVALASTRRDQQRKTVSKPVAWHARD
jgi:hypothetical protein